MTSRLKPWTTLSAYDSVPRHSPDYSPLGSLDTYPYPLPRRVDDSILFAAVVIMMHDSTAVLPPRLTHKSRRRVNVKGGRPIVHLNMVGGAFLRLQPATCSIHLWK